MANIPGYVKRYTGTFTNVGVTPGNASIATPNDVPARGFIYRISVAITGGAGTLIRVTVRETGPAGRIIAVYEDDAIPGDGILAPWDFGDTPLWYERGPGGTLTAVVEATDDAGDTTDGTVEMDVGGPR